MKVAVYTDVLDAAKLLNEPPDTVTSPTTKFVVASLEAVSYTHLTLPTISDV